MHRYLYPPPFSPSLSEIRQDAQKAYNARKTSRAVQLWRQATWTTRMPHESPQSWNASDWNRMYVLTPKRLRHPLRLTFVQAMQQALCILGFPCYHGLTLIANIGDTDLWNEALDAKFFRKGPLYAREQWDKLLGNYSAVADLPAIAFAEDLLTSYPDAKVVLVERDIERWYRSFNEGVIENVWSPAIRLIARLDSRFVGKLGSTSARWTEGWMGAHSKAEMQENARKKYREHYAMVEMVTPPAQFLRYRLDDGWEPLCRFLNKPIPDVDFPRVNEAAALSEKIGLIARRGISNALVSSLWVAIPMAVLALSWWVLRMPGEI